jgi:hypothetical protein
MISALTKIDGSARYHAQDHRDSFREFVLEACEILFRVASVACVIGIILCFMVPAFEASFGMRVLIALGLILKAIVLWGISYVFEATRIYLRGKG